MRVLVFFLVIINAVAFAWFTFQQQVASSESEDLAFSAKALSAAKDLQLLSEIDADELEARDARILAQKALPPPMCALLGVFAESAEAAVFAERLLKHGMPSQQVYMNHTLAPVHWVYIAPAKTRAAAVETLRQLQAERVDSFMVTEGEYMNAISLGYFSKIESAQMIMEQQKAKGYNANAILKAREEEAIWLALDEQATPKFSADLLQNFQLENNALKKQEKVCEELASLKVVE